jgi:mono/diheme cytochrome c family protein
MKRLVCVGSIIIAILVAAAVTAAETNATALTKESRDVWIKAKCALCHGENGAGDTTHGRKTDTPDLRTEATRTKTDEALRACIEQGEHKMPAFRVKLTGEQVELLIRYVRNLPR